jgi:hypothetical protein
MRDRRVCKASPDKLDTRRDRRVAALAAEQYGVVSLADLQSCGLNRAAVTTRVRLGTFHRPHRGVYAVGHANPPRDLRFLAAVKACGPTAVLSHFSAAELWGFYETEAQRVPEVTVVGEGTRARPGISGAPHRCACRPRSPAIQRHSRNQPSPHAAGSRCALGRAASPVGGATSSGDPQSQRPRDLRGARPPCSAQGLQATGDGDRRRAGAPRARCSRTR